MSENLERLLGGMLEKLETIEKSCIKMEKRQDSQDKRIDDVEKVQSRLIWTGSGAVGVIALLWTVVTTLHK